MLGLPAGSAGVQAAGHIAAGPLQAGLATGQAAMLGNTVEWTLAMLGCRDPAVMRRLRNLVCTNLQHEQ